MSSYIFKFVRLSLSLSLCVYSYIFKIQYSKNRRESLNIEF